MPRRSSRRSAPRGPRPTYTWYNDGTIVQTVPSAAASGTDMLQNLPDKAAVASRSTLVRGIFRLGVSSDVSGTIIQGAMGIFVSAGDLATTAFPDPTTDFINWWWLQPYTSRKSAGSAGEDYTVYTADIRTSRRLRGFDRTLWFILENLGLSGSMQFYLEWRLLLRS